MEEAWKQQSPKPRMPNSRQGPQRDNSNEREMDVAELRSYLIIIQTSKATTGFSMSFPEETPENREMWSWVDAASIQHRLSIVFSPRKAWQGLEGSGRTNPPRMAVPFFPQAPAENQRHRLAFTHRCGGDWGRFQPWKTKIPFCLFTNSSGCSEKCLCAGLVRGSLNYSRSS